MEKPIFIQTDRYEIFGVVHEPELDLKKKGSMGFVFCHPFAEEKIISHRVMVKMARTLAQAGFYCLRFDCMGNGDSQGNFEDSTILTQINDIRSAITYLKQNYPIKRVGLIGVRLGATLCVLLGLDDSELSPLILISPIIKGKQYIDKCLRSNLTTQMATYKKVVKDREQMIIDLKEGRMVNVDGYLLTKELYEQIEAINLVEYPVIYSKILIVETSKSERAIVNDDLKKFQEKYSKADSQIQLTIVKEDPFWVDQKIYCPSRKNIEESILQFIAGNDNT